jgi:hypothetical protein
MTNERGKQPWWAPIALVLLSPLILAVLVLALPVAICYFIYGACLHILIWLWWNPRGRDVLFIYSDSPLWHDHVEQNVLPALGSRVIVLNWSDHKRWHFSLSTMAFNYFSTRAEFNPMAIVFRPMRLARIFRFWRPFKDYKRGRPEALKRMEEDFFQSIGVQHYLAV